MLPVVVINPELRSVLAPRFMSVLGMVAMLHLLLDTMYAERCSTSRLCATFFQAALLGFVPEMLEVGAGRKRPWGAHDEPSFLSQGEALALRPASASCGQEVRLCRVDQSERVG